MEKEGINKALTHTLMTYIFALIIIFAIKMMGFDYFGINIETGLIHDFNLFVYKHDLYSIFQFIILYIQLHLMSKILIDKVIKKEIAFITILNLILSTVIFSLGLDFLYTISNILLLFIYFLMKNVKASKIGLFFLVNILFQIITSIVRANEIIEYNFIVSIILSLDYILLLMIYDKVKIGGDSAWEMVIQLVGSFGVHLTNLKNFPTKLQKTYCNNLKRFKTMPKQDKLSLMIFIPLALIYNLMTLAIILFVAFLNDTTVECIFLVTSFMINKKVFGKTFHFSNATTCFIISNLVYYSVNRITFPIEISILVPIIIGVGIAYGSSLLVKTQIMSLKRGMDFEAFHNTITKVIDEHDIDYKICKMYYIDRFSEEKIAIRTNYSISSIKLKKGVINKKIKELL